VQKYCSITNHVWAGFHVSFSIPAWRKLPPDLQNLTHGIFTEAALAERVDFMKMTYTEQENLTAKGLTFNKVDTQPFRDELRKNGFYPEMKKTSGDQVWALLEKYVGPLA
jgi:TRAP-type transport system periplasmic protein